MMLKNVQDVYPLSPMQELMLFNLLSPSSKGLVMVDCYAIEGRLDISSYRQAWEKLVERHTALRTAFVFRELKRPLQVVRRRVDLPWQYFDWRQFSRADADQRLQTLLRERQGVSFEPTRAPLLSLTLVQIGDDSYRLIMVVHHLVVDRWSVSLMLREVGQLYDSICGVRVSDIEEPPQFRDFIGWLQTQEFSQARTYWTRALGEAGASSAPERKYASSETGETEACSVIATSTLSEEITDALRGLARHNHLTLNTLFLGAWALLLSKYSHKAAVTLGMVVAGRPTELENSERMVGLFINNLPVRIAIQPAERLLFWLKGVLEKQAELTQYEQTPLPLIQEWCGMGTEPLFESLLVFQNVEVDASAGVGTGSLRMHLIEGSSPWANVPLIISIYPGVRLKMQINARCVRFARRLIERVLLDFQGILGRLPGFQNMSISALLEEIELDLEEPATDDPPLDGHDRERLEWTAPPCHSAVRNELEQKLIEVWERVLGVHPIGINENFFELGGNSLLALQLMSILSKRIGRKFPLGSLIEAPTVARFAGLFAQEAVINPLSPALVALQPQGSKSPLFLVHASGGDVLFYRHLHLGTERPVFGFQAHGREGRFPTTISIEEMATHYIADMRAIQSGGPYFLGGVAFGGLVALEMGQQLRAAGSEVRLLMLIDPDVPFAVRHSWRYWFRLVFDAMHGRQRQFISHCLEKLKAMSLNRALPWLKSRDPASSATPYSPALSRYVLRAYRGRIACLMNERRASLSRYPWDKIAVGGLDWHTIHARHDNMLLEPYIGELAEILRSCIESREGV